MDYQAILFQREGNVATITMNRPEAMNTINWYKDKEGPERCSVWD